MGFLSEFRIIFKKNIRDYGMYIALFVIIVIFSIVTQGSFISPVNISNLINQTGYVAVLAVGMTLIIIIRHIDLSIGYLSGFLGAVVAIFMTQMGIPVIVSILFVLILGGVIGFGYGLLVAKVRVPAFVVTLGGMMFFHGMEIKMTEATGTISIPDPGFIAIGNGFIPSIGKIGGLSASTLILGLIGILLFIYFQNKERNTKIKYKFEVLSIPFYILKTLLVIVIIGAICVILAGNSGFSWTLVIMGIVVFVYNFLMSKTTLGRHIYGVGGNPEAAELSGIGVAKITSIVFTSMGALTALSGIIYASRMQSASPTGGTGFELQAIAAAFIGGASPSGGIGKVTGSLIGAFVMASLTNGMNLMGLGSSFQFIIQGIILVLAVIFDITTREQSA